MGKDSFGHQEDGSHVEMEYPIKVLRLLTL